MAHRIGSVQLSKWQIALLIGTPMALGLGIYAFRSLTQVRTDDEKSKTNEKTKSYNGKKHKTSGEISLDDDSMDQELGDKKKAAELENEKLSPLKQANIYKEEGNFCYHKGKYDEAITFYDKAIDKCPKENKTDLAIFYQNRAAAYEMLRKWQNVKSDCTQSLIENPRYVKAYFRRAKAHEATNNLGECLNDIIATCILEVFQNNKTIMFADRILQLTGRLDTEIEMSKRVPVLPSKRYIKTHFDSFICDPIITMQLPDTNNQEPMLAKGFVRAKLALDSEDYEDIIPACTEEIERSESESQYKTEALLLRGTMHLISGNYPKALEDLNGVINNADADVSLRVNALVKRASLHLQLEDTDLGMSDFAEAEKLMPDNPDISLQRGQAYLILNKLDDALREYEKALIAAPNHAIAYLQKCYVNYKIAHLSQDQGRMMIVMNEFKNVSEKFPDCDECFSLMGQVLAEQMQYQSADQFYEKAIKIAPNNASIYVHRSILALQWRADIDGALELLHKAIEVDNKCELAYETLGTLEVQRANLKEAVELFEKAIKYAKNKTEMCHLYALRNAAVAQIHVTRSLAMDVKNISRLGE